MAGVRAVTRRVTPGAASDVYRAAPGRIRLAGMFAIRAERDYCIHEDFMKAVRKLADAKKLEGKLDYEKI